jgi:hypothetical protein
MREAALQAASAGVIPQSRANRRVEETATQRPPA